MGLKYMENVQDTEETQEQEVAAEEGAQAQAQAPQGMHTTWNVKTEEGEIELNSGTLLDALLGKVLQTPKQDFDELIVNFAKFLQTRDLFGEMKFNQLIGMSFAIGYFYRVFLEKNDVEIHITDLSNVAQGTEDSDGVEASANTEVETEENLSNTEENNEVVDESAGDTSGEESNSATS
tara:strand:- start:104 stop:640 length:537 start_codon:yes stop_codon:yes gene_type:complete